MKPMRRRLPAFSGTLPRLVLGATFALVAPHAVAETPAPAASAAASGDQLPLPIPTVDFAMTGKSMRGAEMDVAHQAGKMRVEMKKPGAAAAMVSIIDLKSAKMLMMAPNMSRMAMEVELPPQYAALTLRGTGRKLGQDEVAGETCDLWEVNSAQAGNIVACITGDGIALRTRTEVGGAPRIVFEAQSVTRGPQAPDQFTFPPDVQIVKLDGKTLSTLPGALGNLGVGGLGALGGLLQQGQDALKGE